MTKIKFNQLKNHDDFTTEEINLYKKRRPYSIKHIPKKPLKLLKINELQLSNYKSVTYILLTLDYILQKYILQLYTYDDELITSIGFELDCMDNLIMEYVFI